MKKYISLLSIISILTFGFSVCATDNSIGTIYMSTSATLADGLEYNEIYSKNGAGNQVSYMLTHTPGTDSEVLIGYGSGIYGRKTVEAIAQYEMSKGHNVIASVNGNTHAIQSGVTNGTLISDSVLLSWSSAESNNIALTHSGEIITGKDDLSINVSYKAKNYAIADLNKWNPASNGISLYTDVFAPSTKSIGSRIELVLKPDTDKLTPASQVVNCTVVGIYTAPDTVIPEGQFVLSMSGNSAAAKVFKEAEHGDKITVSVNSSKWKNVIFSTGTEKNIIHDSKTVNTSPLPSDNERIARTVIGVDKNLKLFTFVCDGDGTHGKGLTLDELSAHLVSRGVKTAFLLNCGNSSTVTNGTNTVNHPSADVEALVGTTVIFANKSTNNAPTSLKIIPENPIVLKNGTVKLDCVAVNAKGTPTGTPLTNLKYSISSGLGTLSGNSFKAGYKAGNVTLTAKADCNGKTLSGSANISIITALDNIKSSSSAIYVPAGGRAIIPIMGKRADKDVFLNAKSLKWSLSGIKQTNEVDAVIGCKYGYLDNDLVFHSKPGFEGASFTLNASYGYTTIPIKIVIGKPNEVITDFDNISLPFSSYLKTDNGQKFKYIDGMYQSSGMMYTGNAITYKEPIRLSLDAKQLTVWFVGTVTKPYAIVELTDGTRKNVQFSLNKNYVKFNGWKSYNASLPADTAKVISPLASEKQFNCIIDEVTVSYGTVTPSFKDISKSWAKNEIELLYELNITAGYGTKGNLYFKPENSITRAEFAKMMVTYYGLKISDYKNTILNFNDTKDIPAWAIPYVKAAVGEGIIGGSSRPDGTLDFLPNENITRAQVATIIGRRLTCKESAISFKDNGDIPSYAVSGLKKCITAKVLAGYPDGTFRGQSTLTRAEAAKIITSLYKYSFT